MPESPAPGIRWFRTKWRASVSVGGRGARRTTSTLFAADTPVREMRAWQDAAKTRLRATAAADAELQPRPGQARTLDEAAQAYLLTVTAMPSYESRAADLLAWRRALGHVRLDALTVRDLLTTANGWRKAGAAVSTLNHRRTALVACLELHDAALATIARDTLPYNVEPLPVPRELPYPLVRQVLAAMAPSKAAAFLGVMAETGLPPETLRKLTADDVDERRRRVTLGVRQKGGKVAGVVLPLTPAAAFAFAAYRTANAWGGVTRQTLGIVWARACAAVRAAGTVVPDCTPYILRHSFAGRVLDATGGDIQALQQLLQHRDLETTMRYARSRAQRAAVEAIEKLS
jgi:integrase